MRRDSADILDDLQGDGLATPCRGIMPPPGDASLGMVKHPHWGAWYANCAPTLWAVNAFAVKP
jgi:hypothetical protein